MINNIVFQITNLGYRFKACHLQQSFLGHKKFLIKNITTSRPLKVRNEIFMIDATLRLFNAVQVDFKQKFEIPQIIFERTIKHGYLIDPSILPDKEILCAIESVVGIYGKKANASFHKSWSVVQNESMETLITQQIIHYITTYGFKEIGIYSEDTVYIPHEILDLPDIKDDLPLIAIKAMNRNELLEKIIRLGSGIALAKETLHDIMSIINFNKYEVSFVENISNRELKTMLHSYYCIAPTDPLGFLRHLIYQLTRESLLIKNDDLIKKIEKSDGKFLDKLLKDAPDNLASIFFRFKPLFLAMKSISRNKTFFNQLRKKANKQHIPMPEDYMNSITSQIKLNKLDIDLFAQKIKNTSIYRKIRLSYNLNYRLNSEKSIVYRIRNGKGWATRLSWDKGLETKTQQALNITLASIADDIREKVNGKTIFIPANVHYALPSSEKQFIGHIPIGSWISVPKDLIVGIHWTNTKMGSTDLDLSLIGEHSKIGWNSEYRSEDGNILFSGDVTDAPPPHGASELFYIKEGLPEPQIIMVNNYNFHPEDPVNYKIIAAHKNAKNFDKNYMVNVNNIVFSANMTISEEENVLGLIININDENRIYFTNVSVNNSIISSRNLHTMHARRYLIASTVNSISFSKIFTMAGAHVVHKIPDEGEFLDLSPKKLNKNTFLDLFNPK